VVERCEAELADAGLLKYSFLAPGRVTKLRKFPWDSHAWCHVPQRLHYSRGPGDIRYTGYLIVNCRMALALAHFERVAVAVAAEVFGPKRRLKTIQDFGTYNCRRLRGRPELSEHAYGNAIDIGRFYVAGYGLIDVRKHWDSPRRRQAARFLRRLSERLKAERVFTTVLDPDYNEGHRNHFHFDMAPPRWGASSRIPRGERDPDATAPVPVSPPGAGSPGQ
jgi:hypothetical protein